MQWNSNMGRDGNPPNINRQPTQPYVNYTVHSSMASPTPLQHQATQPYVQVANLRRPSLMSDFHQPLSVEVPYSQVKASMLIDRRNTTPGGSNSYHPQTEAISPTPDDQLQNQSNSNQIADKLQKVENEQKHIETKIKASEKLLRELESDSLRPDSSDEKDDICPEDDLSSEAMIQKIYAENRKKAAISHKKLDHLFKNCMNAVPIFGEPSESSQIKELLRKHDIFRPLLINHIRQLNKKSELREKYLAGLYQTQYASWSERVQKWETKPATVQKMDKYRLIFEATFVELKKSREEKERSDRVGVRTTTDIYGQKVTQTSEADEKRMQQQSCIPPMLLDKITQQRLRFNDRNGFVLDPKAEHERRIENRKNMWCDEEKRIFRQKIQQYGKNFCAISMFLERKSTKECVNYYYMTKKRENYKQLLKRQYKKRTKAYRPPEVPSLADLTAPEPTVAAVLKRSRSPEIHSCVQCKETIDPKSNPGRVLTRACYEAYGIDPEESNFRATDVRVCQRCRQSSAPSGPIKVTKTKYTSCPVGICPAQMHKMQVQKKLKSKPTRPLPPRLRQLDAQTRYSLYQSIQMPEDTSKTCTACLKMITALIEFIDENPDATTVDQLIKARLDFENASNVPSEAGAEDTEFEWTDDLDDLVKDITGPVDTNTDWTTVTSQAKQANKAPTTEACVKRHKFLMQQTSNSTPNKTKQPVAGIESEDEENTDNAESPLSTRPGSPDAPSPTIPQTIVRDNVEPLKPTTVNIKTPKEEEKQEIDDKPPFMKDELINSSTDALVESHFKNVLGQNYKQHSRIRTESAKSNDSTTTLSADEGERKSVPPARPCSNLTVYKPKFHHTVQTVDQSKTKDLKTVVAMQTAEIKPASPITRPSPSDTTAISTQSPLSKAGTPNIQLKTQANAVVVGAGGSLTKGTPVRWGQQEQQKLAPPVPVSSSKPSTSKNVVASTSAQEMDPATLLNEYRKTVKSKFLEMGYMEAEVEVLVDSELNKIMQHPAHLTKILGDVKRQILAKQEATLPSPSEQQRAQRQQAIILQQRQQQRQDPTKQLADVLGISHQQLLQALGANDASSLLLQQAFQTELHQQLQQTIVPTTASTTAAAAIALEQQRQQQQQQQQRLAQQQQQLAQVQALISNCQSADELFNVLSVVQSHYLHIDPNQLVSLIQAHLDKLTHQLQTQQQHIAAAFYQQQHQRLQQQSTAQILQNVQQQVRIPASSTSVSSRSITKGLSGSRQNTPLPTDYGTHTLVSKGAMKVSSQEPTSPTWSSPGVSSASSQDINNVMNAYIQQLMGGTSSMTVNAAPPPPRAQKPPSRRSTPATKPVVHEVTVTTAPSSSSSSLNMTAQIGSLVKKESVTAIKQAPLASTSCTVALTEPVTISTISSNATTAIVQPLVASTVASTSNTPIVSKVENIAYDEISPVASPTLEAPVDKAEKQETRSEQATATPVFSIFQMPVGSGDVKPLLTNLQSRPTPVPTPATLTFSVSNLAQAAPMTSSAATGSIAPKQSSYDEISDSD